MKKGFYIRLPVKIYRELKCFCASHAVPMSAVVAELIKAHLSTNKNNVT